MGEKNDDFGQLMNRLHEIVDLVRQEDLSLEKSLDLLEEGIELANRCTERVDRISVSNKAQEEVI